MKMMSRIGAILLSISMAATMVPASVPAQTRANAAADVLTASTASTVGIADDDILIKDTVTRVAPGVTVHEVVTNTAAGNDQKIDYLCDVDLQGTSTTKIVAAYGSNYSTDKWELVTTTKQAAAYEAKTGETVVAAINADFFNMATGEPMGALVMDSNVGHPVNNRTYFAILKDGTADVRRAGTPLDDVREAVGGDAILLWDGEVQPYIGAYGTEDYSRQAIGVRADGSVVTFTTYGNKAPISCGRTYAEIAQMLKANGCVKAIALDGGGSATLAARAEGSDKLAVINHPSDGAEREVSSSLLIVSTAKADGIFDHAAVTPNNELYTPGSEVAFAATGVDGSGAPVDLPEGLTWALAEDSASLGTIDAATGVFTAAETTGVVNVELKQGDEVVGSTSIEIVTPDQIYFSNDEVSLDFEESTDLGIVVRNKGRDVNIKDGDLVWSLTVSELGAFTGNTFVSSESASTNGNATAVSRWDESVSGTIHIIVGMLPTVVWDFEDVAVTDEVTGETTTVPAADYYINGYADKAAALTHSNYGRGGNESIEIVSIDDDEPVRFGSHALKLNYDFINCGAVTEGACVGTTEGMTVPGTPTKIGAWVYAPEGTGITYTGIGSQAGFWLRGYVRNGANANVAYDFTLEPKQCQDASGNWNGVQPGISWEGWMYCEADLTGIQPPYSIQPGMTFRLMYVAGTNMGSKTAGAIYFDNLQFVYGANVDDTENPVVDSIQLNGEELEDGAVIDTNTVNVDAFFHDVQNKYTTGIDKDTVRMYVDGISVVDNASFEYALDPDGTRNHLYNAYLLNGEHSLTVSLRDGFGNETSETRYFTIQAEERTDLASVSVAPAQDGAVLGKTVDMEIRATDSSVTAATASLVVDNQFPEYTVTFGENYEGTAVFKKLTKTLNIDAVRKADAGEDTLIATISYKVPVTLTENAKFAYTVKSASYTIGEKIYTFSKPQAVLPVTSTYVVTADPIIVGTAGTIHVEDHEGNAAAGVHVYYAGEEDEELGITDENGDLITERFSEASGTFKVYAKDDTNGLSFQTTVGSFDSQGDVTVPYGIVCNTVKDAKTQKNFGWFSSPKAAAQSLRYRTADTEEWTVVEAEGKLLTFTKGGNQAAVANKVELTGLTAGTTYTYQVGSEEGWSAEDTFTTKSASSSTSFFVLGDIQAEDLTNITNLAKAISEKDYDFGLQTGDAVDDPTYYPSWVDVADLLGEKTIGETDMIHVLGNHEYAGDATANRAKSIFDLPDSEAGGHYSVTYGNVYVAVINYAGNSNLYREALDWMVEDAKKSNATWKILSIHQPAYFTNANGGNSDVHALVPAACEKAGINFVFSGHDHSYARTESMVGGEVQEEGGVIYYICGSSGEKSYAITENDDFHFAKLSGDFRGIYLSFTGDKNSATVTTYDLDAEGNAQVMDEVTVYTRCYKNGHTVDTASYDPETNQVFCSVCGEPAEGYTGEVTSAAGDTYYLLAGAKQTGWVTVGEDFIYCAPDTGIKEEVTTIEDVPTTCTERGHYVLQSASGAQKSVRYAQPAGHEYEEQEDGSFVCSVCQNKRIELKDCTITTPYKSLTYTGTARTMYPTVVDPNGYQLVGGQVDFFVRYANNVEVGTATMSVVAKSGYNTNLTEYRGAYGGTVEIPYQIRPDLAVDVQPLVGADQVTLSWTAAKCAPSYVIQKSVNGTKWTDVAKTEETTYTVDGLDYETTYMFRIRSEKVVDEITYTSIGTTVPVTVTTEAGVDITGCTVEPEWTEAEYNGNAQRPALTVTNAEGVDLVKDMDYTSEIEAITNVGTGSYTVTGKGRYFGTIEGGTFTVVPQDLTETAVVEAEDAVYRGTTGTTIKVTDKYGNVLKSDDYEVSYEGNDSIGAATVIVTGKGNYTGTVTGTFNITAADMEDIDVKLDEDADLAYTGSEIKPAVIIEGLNEGEDYTVAYENNIEIGTATVTVTGEENVTGTKTLTFEITARDIAGAEITDGSTYSYNEEAIEVDINVVNELGTILVEGVDYELGNYQNNVEAGTASVTVTGIGNYTGSVEHTFEILAADVKTMTVAINPEEYVYNGAERKPKVTVTNQNGKTLRSTSYSVEYVDNKNAGTAKVIVTGIGSYIGTVERSFVINAADLTACTATLSYETVQYNGAEKKPSVTVKTAKGTTLTKGTNYDVVYTNNKKAGTATVTITGINNYAGTIEKTFEITRADISVCTIDLAAEVHYADGKAYEPAVTVTTAKGTVLKNGVSYELTYKNNVAAGTASAVIKGIGNYTGTVTKTFKISPTTDISTCDVTLAYSIMSYTGEKRTPAVTVKTAKGTTLKKDTNYSVTYKNNVKVGVATVTVKGMGKYSGTVTRTFTIRPDAPTDLRSTSTTPNSVKISFAPSKMADKYYVYVNGKYTVALKSTTNVYTLKNLKAGTAYTIEVKAVKVVNSVNYYSAATKLKVTTTK